MQLVNALNECGQNELPRPKSNCLQLPPTAYCSHSKVSPSLTCLSRFFCVSPPLPTSYSTPFSLLLLYSSLPSRTVFYLPLKAAEISFEICVCKFSCCCFRCFFFFFALVCLSCRFSSSVPPPASLRSTACHVSFMFICLSCDMCHMKYGGYDIRNMSSLNFPQCYCYSSQPRSGFAFPFFSFFFSASSSAPSFSFSFPFVYFALCEFRLCK